MPDLIAIYPSLAGCCDLENEMSPTDPLSDKEADTAPDVEQVDAVADWKAAAHGIREDEIPLEQKRAEARIV